eukprot:gene30587-39855_t
MLKDRHDQLIVAAKSLMENPGRDCPQKLSKLILKYFPDCRGFNVNWRCSTIENNSLITLAARHGHLKCMALLVEKFNSSIELGDVGGFTPLIASAYRGSFNCVMYCIEKGASACARGRLRSGPPLMPECWAMIQGYEELFNYLRATRLRQEAKSASSPSSSSSTCLPICDMMTSSNELAGDDALPERDPSMIGITGVNSSSSSSSSSSSLGSFCICGQGFVGKMIACEKAGCTIEWFHFQCVGLSQEPTGVWHCPSCMGEKFMQPIAKRSLSPPARKRKVRRSDDCLRPTGLSSAVVSLQVRRIVAEAERRMVLRIVHERATGIEPGNPLINDMTTLIAT